MDLFVMLLLRLLFEIFCPTNKENEDNDLNGNAAAYFFGSNQLNKEDKNAPINDNYDQGPDW